MARRPGAHVVYRYPAPSGEHPNKYVGEITVDFRVFWTPETDVKDIDDAIAKTIFELHRELARRYDNGR